MSDISKIKLANGTTVLLKDAQGRADMTTLLGTHALAALKAAAWLGADTAITEAASDENVATAKATKEYVDAQVGAIHKFDVVVADQLPEASADEMYKIYLTPDQSGSGSNVKIESIVIRSGSEGAYTYRWEQIGTTETDLTGYVKKVTKVAGIDLQDDITVTELQVALELGKMAYVDTATGSTTLDTIDSITMAKVTVAGDAVVTTSTAAATLTKAAYTPAGSVTGEAIKGGSIEVTVKDATTATAATLTKADYTPAGTVTAAAEDGTITALTTAAFQKSDAATAIQIEGTVSKPAITVTPSTEAVLKSVSKAAVAPTFTQGTKAALTDQTTSAFTTEGITAAVGSGDDAECLIFSTAAVADAVTDRGTFTANGDDTWDAGSAAEFATQDVVIGAAAALDAAPTFTGAKYDLSTAKDTALKSVVFTGTKVADALVTGVDYLKQEIDKADFTPVAASLGFAGTEVADALVTGVTYDKADAKAAYSTDVTPTVASYAKTGKTVEITVSPDAKK